MSIDVPMTERPTLALKGHIDFCACNVHRAFAQFRLDYEGNRSYSDPAVEAATTNFASQLDAIEALRERGTWDLLAQALTMPQVATDPIEGLD